MRFCRWYMLMSLQSLRGGHIVFSPIVQIMEIGTEISHKIKTAIKSKLVEFGSYVDDELPDYIMVMVANKRSQSQMCDDLNLFLGENSQIFCEWLHDLLQKLQEVTEGAFEVKVPVPTIKTKPEEVKPKNKSDGNESLKISRISRKPSPIRMPSENEASDVRLKITNKKAMGSETSQKKEGKNSGLLQSAVVVQKRPILPASQQANVNLLKKAMKAAQGSVEDIDEGEYNPELPAAAELPNDPESKKKQREILLEEHKKLQRLKSQQEETEETREPMIEIEVAEDDDLFNVEETSLTKDRRIVVEKGDNSEIGVSKEEENLKKKKEKKPEKRKLEENEDSQKQTQSESESENTTKSSEETQQKSGKTKEKRRKPKFIVTLEGVGNEFEEKYEKERKKKKRKGSHKEENKIAVPHSDPPQLIPVYPPMIPDLHHVPVLPPAHLGNPHLNPMVPAVQVIPTTIMAPVDTPKNTSMEEDFADDDMLRLSETKCRFWPQCKNGDDCPYYHPGVSCKHFPNCRYGKDCSYTHPPCKFGAKCTSTSCSYSHPSQPALTENPTVCRYYPFCTRTDCPFLHPTEKPCRYGSNCTRSGCPFGHSVPPPREQLKWVAPKAHVSERQFAVNEANTTPLQVQ